MITWVAAMVGLLSVAFAFVLGLAWGCVRGSREAELARLAAQDVVEAAESHLEELRIQSGSWGNDVPGRTGLVLYHALRRWHEDMA